jgi:hypothetical protein
VRTHERETFSVSNIIAIYIRMPLHEVERLRDHPEILPKYDPRVALGDGRGLDLGRAWAELGCFLDGGVKVPDEGPTVGEIHIPAPDERAMWSYVTPDRVKVVARALADIKPSDFRREYKLDPEETADALPEELTGVWKDRATYYFGKLQSLTAHYAKAAARDEAMLVRIGERI